MNASAAHHARTTRTAHAAAAAAGSLLGLLLLAGPASARDIGPGDPLSAGSTSSQCRNVVPEDRIACQGTTTRQGPLHPVSEPKPQPGSGFASSLSLDPGTLGFVALGGLALAGTAVVATRHRHGHLHHPA